MEGSPEARVTVTNEYLFEDDETGSALNRYETDYAGDSTAATGINDTMAFLDEQIEFDEPVNNDNFPSIASAVDSLKAKGQYRKASANWSTAAAASEGDSSLSITDYSIFDRGFNIVEIDDPPDRPAAPTSLDQLFKGKREGPTAGATGAMETPAAPGTTAIEGTSKTPGGVSPSFKQQRDLISAFLERQMGSSEKTPGHVTQITPAGPSASGSDTDSKLPRIQVTADDERGSREPSEENSETGQQLEPVKLRRRDTGSSGLQPPAADEEDDAESATSDVELDYERNWYRLTSAHEPQPDYKQDKKHHHRSNSHHRMRQSDLLKTHL
ncbi:uncharacterized protein LOC141904566 [Tubulanus polymorphus]|uniref:uncharacterized protein LOC141904566 n=1 Tax=Tubulanus polymorphus TaxID=672921 RepID=UPI003DA25FFE